MLKKASVDDNTLLINYKDKTNRRQYKIKTYFICTVFGYMKCFETYVKQSAPV